MVSLQKFLFTPEVADSFGMSPSALYERQRALVRSGLLPRAASRGRGGGGAAAVPDTVAMIVLSVLVTDNLSEVDERMAVWAELRALQIDYRPGGWIHRVGKCSMTKQRTLHKAISSIIEHGHAHLIVELNRRDLTADIIDISDPSPRSRFGKSRAESDYRGVQILARFPALFNISQLLEIQSAPGESR